MTEPRAGSPGRRLRHLARFFLSAFLVDGAVNLTLVGIPYRAIAFGASSFEIGLLPAVWSVVYITSSIALGRLSDRSPRHLLIRAGALLVAVAMLVLRFATAVPHLAAALALMAVGLALFWPSLQAALSEAGDPRDLRRNLGAFNLSWSSGKGIGFASGGFIHAASGFAPLPLISGAIALGVALLTVPRPARARLVDAEPAPAMEPPPLEHAPARPGLRAAFLLMAWVANSVAYGANATLAYHYPKLLESQGLQSAHFGLFLGLTYISQTATFAFLLPGRGWPWRRWPLYLVHGVLAAVLVVLSMIRIPVAQLLLAPFVGLALGTAYYSSILYSLSATPRPGRNTGLHEAMIGAGLLIAPPVGGLLVRISGNLAAPLLFAAVVVLVAVVVEEGIHRRAVRTP